MATYTTPSLVRKRLKWIDPGITDADINAMIEQAEGVKNPFLLLDGIQWI